MTYTFVFTDQELNVIFQALQDRPFREVAPVIDNIRIQINAAQAEESKKEEENKNE